MQTKTCQNCKRDFTIEPDDFDFYDRMKVPPPTWCPQCRLIRRMVFRNEQSLFKRKDAHTGDIIFSGFHEDVDVKTYKNNYWMGDEWDKCATGRDYDFSRPFFEQFKELRRDAPLPALSVLTMINSDYCNEAGDMKNCYLCFNADYCEDSSYLVKGRHIKDSLDLYESKQSEYSYDSSMLTDCNRCFYSQDCESCVDVWFSKDLRGCTNCFGCVNLRNKSYCIFNKQYTKDEYDRELAKYNVGSYKQIQALKKEVREFWLQFPNKYYHGNKNLNSSGEKVSNTKNVQHGFSVRGGENMKYVFDLYPPAANSYDYTIWGDKAENIYESVVCGVGIYNLKFCSNSWEDARDLEYCIFCFSCSDCFGCVGLHKKKYCIFNKQYTKEEYFDLKEKIIAQMKELPYIDKNGREFRYGEFFPYDCSLYAYNESLAYYFFPLTKEEALQQGFAWRDAKESEYITTLDSRDLADTLHEVSDDILKETIKCSACARAYRIIQTELGFYRRMNIPIPRLCQKCRFEERFQDMTKPVYHQRECMCEHDSHGHEGKCKIAFETAYEPDRPEIVYCEDCYQKEVV